MSELLFLSIILFIYYLVGLVKNGHFKKIVVKYVESKISYANGNISEEEWKDNLVVYLATIIITMFALLAIEIPLLIMGMASSNKFIVYASVGYFVYLIVFTLIGTAINKKKKAPDLTCVEEANKYRAKMYSNGFIGFVNHLISLAFFGFIIYELLVH